MVAQPPQWLASAWGSTQVPPQQMPPFPHAMLSAFGRKTHLPLAVQRASWHGWEGGGGGHWEALVQSLQTSLMVHRLEQHWSARLQVAPVWRHPVWVASVPAGARATASEAKTPPARPRSTRRRGGGSGEGTDQVVKALVVHCRFLLPKSGVNPDSRKKNSECPDSAASLICPAWRAFVLTMATIVHRLSRRWSWVERVATAS